MMLGNWKSYLAVYNFLHKYWLENSKEVDELPIILGGMSPYTFKDSLPSEMDLFSEWIDVYKEQDILKEEASIEEVFDFMITYVEKEGKNYSVNLNALVEKLKQTRNNHSLQLWTNWIDACTQAVSE